MSRYHYLPVLPFGSYVAIHLICLCLWFFYVWMYMYMMIVVMHSKRTSEINEILNIMRNPKYVTRYFLYYHTLHISPYPYLYHIILVVVYVSYAVCDMPYVVYRVSCGVCYRTCQGYGRAGLFQRVLDYYDNNGTLLFVVVVAVAVVSVCVLCAVCGTCH
jgi:hypothetical protein